MTNVKICGVTRLDDAERAVELGAWAIGLNHWMESPRRVDPSAAFEIGNALKRRCEIVGVFVNPTLEQVVQAAEDEQLTLVQLHGDEGPSFCAEVARRTGCSVIKSRRVRSAADVKAAESYRTAYHLLDAHQPGAPGGTGESFDWELLSARRSQVPLILAGGLRAQNVAEAISIAHPFAVDVASGVESEPGVKDPALLEALFEAVRDAVPSGT
jgi:phosphoribosylanthranilate isomerase